MKNVKIQLSDSTLLLLTEMASKTGIPIEEFLSFHITNLALTPPKNPVGRPPKTPKPEETIHICYVCNTPLTKSAFGWTNDGADNPHAKWIHASCNETQLIAKTKKPAQAKKSAERPGAIPTIPTPEEIPRGRSGTCKVCYKNVVERHAIGLIDSTVKKSMAPGVREWVHVDCLEGNPPDLIAIVVDRARQVNFEKAVENYAGLAERWLASAYAWDAENPKDIIDKSAVLDGLTAVNRKEEVISAIIDVVTKNVGPVTRPNVTGHSHMPLPHSSPSEGHTVTSPNLIAALSAMQVGRGNICRGCDARITPGQEYAICEDCTSALDEYIDTGAKVNLLAFRTFCIERRWRTSEQVE